MKNVSYIPRVEPDRTPKDKVVDLAVWKAEHVTEPDEPKTERTGPKRRRGTRRSGDTALDWAELAATLAVAAAFLALAAQVLLF